MTLAEIISSLVAYGVEKGLTGEENRVYAENELLRLFGGSEYARSGKIHPFPEALAAALAYAKEQKLAEMDNLNEEDNFAAALLDRLMGRPSEVISRFWELYKESPRKATDWYYQFAIASLYVRQDRLQKNIEYSIQGEKAALDITINLSKPEKDPKEIARLGTLKSSSYPKCALCRENEGFYGSYSQAGRSNHRLIPLKLNGENFFFQYSPYGYYNEHCIVLKEEHVPMVIDEKTFLRLFDFLDLFPHYFLGSNADLPIVGGSILSHEHYQGGRHVFPLERAPLKKEVTFKGFEDISAGLVAWPVSVLRLTSSDRERLTELCVKILNKWRTYSDESLGILSSENGVGHNTLTPIARRQGAGYQIDLALRNNRTSAQYPLGIYHPHPEYFHIKKENIGLIEVMGLAILPGRLKDELALCQTELVHPSAEPAPALEKHLAWLQEVRKRHPEANEENAEAIIRQETGLVFEKVLECCGVYKDTPEGLAGFLRFVKAV
jgi:UDPglucose--hexose-1-phosphate uridylyltransferase